MHEADVTHLENAESAYLYAAQTCPGWRIVDCIRPELRGKEGILRNPTVPTLTKVRPLSEINDEIYAHVKEILGS